jgi:geranylgeranyl pyrophosphate synthase
MRLPSHTDPSLRSKASAVSGLHQSTVPSFRLIDEELRQVKRLIDEQLAEGREPVGRLLRCANIHGGKILRPGLVLLSYRAVRDGSCAKGLIAKRIENTGKSQKLRESSTSGGAGVSENQRDTPYQAIYVAAIVELIHNATLLHDDIIDGGQKRRGLPTVSSMCGNESAVLLGDFLLSKAFKVSADLEPEIADIIAGTTVRVCEGELRRVAERQNWQLSEPEYIGIITEKSASLFSCCCLLGGLLAGAGERQARSLADFGLNAGIAFQITEDLLDIVVDESKTGKTPGSDIDNNRLTLAVIHLLKAVDRRERNEVINSYLVNGEVCTEIDTRCEKESLAEKLVRLGSLEYAHRRAQEFVTKALEALSDLEEGEAKDALIETAKFIGRRAI